MPLVGKPLWENLPIVWPEAGADGAPDLDTVAEWLVWFGGDAQRWWGGLEVTTDRGTWQLGEGRPVRTILEGATACRITRRPEAAQVISLVLSHGPHRVCRAVAALKYLGQHVRRSCCRASGRRCC